MAAAWNDQNCKPHVRSAAAEIRDRFAVFNIGGYRSGADAQDHGLGLAIDVMTTVRGGAIAEWAKANASRLRITYIIWARRIWDSRNARGWESYKGPNPHIDHVHISFHPSGNGGNTDVGGIDGLAQNPGCVGWLLSILGAGPSASTPERDVQT